MQTQKSFIPIPRV